MTKEAFIAANRFGLGPRAGELASLADDPRGRLRAQLRSPAGLDDSLPDTQAIISVMRELATSRKADPAVAATAKAKFGEARLALQKDRLQRQIVSTVPFRERLVLFWSNHFAVSARKGSLAPLAYAHEREAIAPHVAGRFVTLLKAAVLHPAMLVYLDQASSVGPNSRQGRNGLHGLNENLGREILELHTLGVDGGYTQDDVKALAAILTGWTVNTGRCADECGLSYGFDPDRHQPGPKTLIGHVLPEAGEGETEAALELLARQPATAHMIATKLVRHFVADVPPQAAIDHIADVFLSTEGDLGAVSEALIGLDQAWAEPQVKFKTPWEFVVGAGRLAGDLSALDSDRRAFLALNEMGQPPLSPPSPAGWPDKAEAWLTSAALLRRVAFAGQVAGRIAPRADVAALFAASVEPVAADDTRRLILNAGSATEALTLLMASVEFQRR